MVTKQQRDESIYGTGAGVNPLYAMHHPIVVFCLLVAVQARHSKDITFLRSAQPVELAHDVNETTEVNSNGSNNKIDAHGLVILKKDTNDTSRDSRGLLKKLHFFKGGFISGSGTLAASNSLKIFGKVMNTALSVSYGHADDIDPLPEIGSDHNQEGDSDEKEIRLKPGITALPPLKSSRKQFIKTHNAQVSRINHKFLKTDPFGEAS